MSDITRRKALVQLAAAFAASGVIDPLAARDAHALIVQGVGAARAYRPQALSASEFRALLQLVDLIIPVEDGRPGALEAGVAAWIDTLCHVNGELKNRYTAGLSWIDRAMTTRHGMTFVEASAGQRIELLDRIAYRKNASAELNSGIEFFGLVRRMTVDGFYTSPVGMRDIYLGTMARSEFTVPKEALDYVLSRSPFRP